MEREDRRTKDTDSFTQIYIAKLHKYTRESDLQDAFSKFGKIKQIVLKHSYAFIDFEEHEAAVQAIKEMDGKTFINGEELVVEQSGREKMKFWLENLKHECSARWKEKKDRTANWWCVLQLSKERSLVSIQSEQGALQHTSLTQM